MLLDRFPEYSTADFHAMVVGTFWGFLRINQHTAKQMLALVPQHEERGDHLLTNISDSPRVRGAVVLEGFL